ncbi:MAG: DUF3422 family protein [Roseovarius sp.]
MPPIQDHPLRYDLVNELHARPFPVINAPSSAVYMAIKRESDAASRNREDDLAHLIDLLDRHGAPHPQPGATHYFGNIGRHQLKWERHTEFVTYTVFTDGLSDRAFDPQDFEVFPSDWLDTAPGVRMTSALIRITPWTSDADFSADLHDNFVSESVAVARVLDNDAILAGDFRIDPAGHLRFAISVSPGTRSRRIGRVVQRLCEIETYKTMSMLGFAKVRQLGPEMGALDERLGDLIGGLATNERPAEVALEKLLTATSELEALVARTSFRISATMAYDEIVNQRIGVLRETRFEGRQTFAEFMMRRFQPAMRTVQSSKARMDAMADRATRAGHLLRTRVDVERSAQNQNLLESMDKRADLQLRLQRTVEGLSVVAISYYAVSLAGYLLYPLADRLEMSREMLLALVTLPIVGLVWWMVNRIRKSMH